MVACSLRRKSDWAARRFHNQTVGTGMFGNPDGKIKNATFTGLYRHVSVYGWSHPILHWMKVWLFINLCGGYNLG